MRKIRASGLQGRNMSPSKRAAVEQCYSKNILAVSNHDAFKRNQIRKWNLYNK